MMEVRSYIVCAVLLGVVAFCLESGVAAVCCASNGGMEHIDNCKCQANGGCHPNSNSLSITTYFGESDCEVFVESEWGPCTPAGEASLFVLGGEAEICGSGGNDECSGESWDASGRVCVVGCPAGFRVHQDVEPDACGSCAQSTEVLGLGVTCTFFP